MVNNHFPVLDLYSELSQPLPDSKKYQKTLLYSLDLLVKQKDIVIREWHHSTKHPLNIVYRNTHFRYIAPLRSKIY